MARKVIGRGLDALLRQNGTTATGTDDEQVVLAKTAEIRPSPFQPRHEFRQEQIDELAASIRERGLIQPLIVRKVNGHYELIAGERRLRAVSSLGMEQVKVVVMEATDLEAAEITLIENLQREDLSPLEEAEQYRLLMSRFGMTQETIARHVGKSRAMVANMVRLLELCPAVRTLLEQGKITVGHAKVLLQLKDAATQELAVQRLIQRALTVRQTEQFVRSLLQPLDEPPPKQGEPSEHPVAESEERFTVICRELADSLSARVAISPKGRRGGTIEISYANQAELIRLLKIFGISARP